MPIDSEDDKRPYRPDVAVLLPGSGSRSEFIERAFGPALRHAGIPLLAPQPDPEFLVESSLELLTAAATGHTRLLVGGVSIGAAIGVLWAARNPGNTAAIAAALPAWTGEPHEAPAAHSARHTSAQLRAHGLETVIRDMRATSPAWLADELDASWRKLWPGLPAALAQASEFSELTEAVLAAVPVPTGIAAATDDPVHPWETAKQWSAHLQNSHITPVTLVDAGRDPAVLGHACLTSLRSLGAV
ncbi:alpha/beta hydrolase [Hoyosella sp. YIM 151337]|uniref:alpha/beta hydrolase n=1 Tax=Hoyosella sp. YIM 151337 TaxID=2992742 RepID=UPI0022354ACC|nr:alpha/beta hydrolase [Hoyosella sp. YIM 151337]MCW4353291.1 alpha/beta hydrolase [Hoyosella sp. YIM 151337]